MGTAIGISMYNVTRRIHSSWLSALLVVVAMLIATILYNQYDSPSVGSEYTFGSFPLLGLASLVIPTMAGFISVAVLASRQRRKQR